MSREMCVGQSLRRGFAAPPPFTQGRLWNGARDDRGGALGMTGWGACGTPLFAPRPSTQQCSVIEQSGVAVSGSGCRGHGAAPRAGFWVLLGGPKVPPRAAVLRKRIRRGTSTRFASMVRRSLRRGTFDRAKVPKARWGVAMRPRPLSLSATQGDCGPPGAKESANRSPFRVWKTESRLPRATGSMLCSSGWICLRIDIMLW